MYSPIVVYEAIRGSNKQNAQRFWIEFILLVLHVHSYGGKL